jgi:uncharacterized protein YebE (UPF0316 family)
VTVTFHILLTGVLIFFARIVDVSVGTVRTIVTVQGRTRLAFVLGFIEVTIWVTIISAIVQQIYTAPILAIFYGLGFATGNVVGIALERKIALGHVALRAFSRTAGPRAAARLRDAGQMVTTFSGEGRSGPVTELLIVCRRKDIKWILESIKSDDPEAFYIVEQAREVSHVQMPAYSVPTGWRAVLKRK